jgi:hypothetical protein
MESVSGRTDVVRTEIKSKTQILKGKIAQIQLMTK